MAAKRPKTPSTLTNDGSPPVGPWGQPPSEATRWTARLIQGSHQTKLSYVNDDEGVQEYEFPMDDLSIETLRERWGSGKYQLQWMADAAGKRITCGNGRQFILTPLPGDANFSEQDDEEDDDEDDEDDDGENEPAPPNGFDPLGPLTAAMQMLTVVQGMADAQTEKHMRMHKDSMESSLNMARLLMEKDDRAFDRQRQEKEESQGIVAMRLAMLEMSKVVTQQEQKIAALLHHANNPVEPAPNPPGAAGFSINPGDSPASIATAVVANQVVAKLPEMISMGVSLAGAFMDDRKEKAQIRANAAMQQRVEEQTRRATTVPFVPNAAPTAAPPPVASEPAPTNPHLPKADTNDHWKTPVEATDEKKEEAAS